MGWGKKLAWTFGAVAGAAVLAVGGTLSFAKINENKLYECHPENTPMTALVVKWRLTGGYGLGILNADNRIVYAENNEAREPLQQKAELFCRTRQLTVVE